MQISFNCTQQPSFSKKKSVFMGEEQAPVAPQPASKSASAAQPATQPTVPNTETKGPVLQPQPAQDTFKKVECKDCKDCK